MTSSKSDIEPLPAPEEPVDLDYLEEAEDGTYYSTLEMIAMLVEAKPYLYNKAHKEFKDARLKSNTWDEIAKECGLAKDVVQTKWKSMRDRYSRERRKKKPSGSGSKGEAEQHPWPMFYHLQFLEPFIATRAKSTTNVQRKDSSSEQESSSGQNSEGNNDDDQTEDTDCLLMDDSSCIPKDKNSKRKKSADDALAQSFCDIAQAFKKKQEAKDCVDEDTAFANNLALELKKIKSNRIKRQLKLKISTLLYEIDEGDDLIE